MTESIAAFFDNPPPPIWVWVVVGVVLVIVVAVIAATVDIRRQKKRVTAWITIFATKEPLQTWRADQEWRKPTGVRLLEDLKEQLVSDENLLVKGRDLALSIQSRLNGFEYVKANPPDSLWFEVNTKLYEDTLPTKARQGCEQLDRLWAGDAHLEIEDGKDTLQRLKQALSDVPQDSKGFLDIRARQRLNEQVLKTDRELRDLNEIVRRAQQRAVESKHRVTFREAEELSELNRKNKIKIAFQGVRTQLEVNDERLAMVREVEANKGLTEEQRKQFIEDINRAADEAFSKAKPLLVPKPGSIYREGQG